MPVSRKAAPRRPRKAMTANKQRSHVVSRFSEYGPAPRGQVFQRQIQCRAADRRRAHLVPELRRRCNRSATTPRWRGLVRHEQHFRCRPANAGPGRSRLLRRGANFWFAMLPRLSKRTKVFRRHFSPAPTQKWRSDGARAGRKANTPMHGPVQVPRIALAECTSTSARAPSLECAEQRAAAC